MNYLMCIGGLLFVILAPIWLGVNFEQYRVQLSGTVVKMEIVKLPSGCGGTRVPYWVYFKYKDKTYDRQTRGSFCQNHHVGEIVSMKMLEGSDYILYPDESVMGGFVAVVILGLFGLYIFIVYAKKIKNC